MLAGNLKRKLTLKASTFGLFKVNLTENEDQEDEVFFPFFVLFFFGGGAQSCMSCMLRYCCKEYAVAELFGNTHGHILALFLSRFNFYILQGNFLTFRFVSSVLSKFFAHFGQAFPKFLFP